MSKFGVKVGHRTYYRITNLIRVKQGHYVATMGGESYRIEGGKALGGR